MNYWTPLYKIDDDEPTTKEEEIGKHDPITQATTKTNTKQVEAEDCTTTREEKS